MHTAFAYPWLLASVVPLLGLGVLAWRDRRRRRRALADLGSGLPQPEQTRTGVRRLRAVLLALGLIFLCVGAAGPQWGRDWEQASAPGRDLMVVLDRSRSMLAEKPSRLERARMALLEFAAFLKKRGGGQRLGLVVFAAKARLVCPLTHDYDHFREAIVDINPELADPELAAAAESVSGTRMGLALQAAVLAHTEATGPARDILLLSDGDDPVRDGEWSAGVLAARRAGIPIFTVGLGDPDEASLVPALQAAQGPPLQLEHEGQPVRSRLDEGRLREIAQATGGIYEAARRQTPPLGPLYLHWVTSAPLREQDTDALPVYRQRPLWCLTPALVLLVLAMVVGDRVSARRKT